ncbi:MAG: TldD/PmbA family protein [Clostridia bacterium]|nr:TldD/PmbA family protein [Clostridia bacterium]
MMTFDEFKKKAFDISAELGCEAAEVYFNDGETFSVNVLGGELDEYSVEHSFGLNLRVIYGGRAGYAYTEMLDDPRALVLRAVDNAKAVENDDVMPMQGKCEYRQIAKPECRASGLTPTEKIAYAEKLEKDLMAADPRVIRTMYCAIQTTKSTTRLHNTLGLEADNTEELSASILCPIMQQDGVVKDSFIVKTGNELFDTDAMIKEVVRKVADQFGASPVPSGEYSIIMQNEAMANMLAAFSPMFSADNAQKGMSLLAGREGETIAADCVTLMDDPFYKEYPRAFDAEGVPSVTKEVISKGVLTTLLHNLQTAAKAGTASTSNAGRGASGPVTVAPSNFYIVPGETDYDSLLGRMGSGVVITDVSGLHAGLNPVSGDFSLIAKGQLVEGGRVVRAVDQITVAGNFLTMMKNIAVVGSDLKFGMPGMSRFGSPSLLIEKLMVSGE